MFEYFSNLVVPDSAGNEGKTSSLFRTSVFLFFKMASFWSDLFESIDRSAIGDQFASGSIAFLTNASSSENNK